MRASDSPAVELHTPMSLAIRVNMALDPAIPRQVLEEFELSQLEWTQPFPSFLPEMICVCVDPVRNRPVLNEEPDVGSCPLSVTVGKICGEAVLSGADVYAPGVAAWPAGVSGFKGVLARIYADATDKILRGGVTRICERPCLRTHVFLGIGLLEKDSREDVFRKDASGIAVRMIRRVWRAPSLRFIESLMPEANSIALQTFPSQIVSKLIDPSADDRVLDMCAAPGNKTAHLATLLLQSAKIQEITGSITAIARTKRKKELMQRKLVDLQILPKMNKQINIVIGDACNAAQRFGFCKFDKVLLDAPCSGTGSRPRLSCASNLSGDQKTEGALFLNEQQLQKQLLCVAAQVVRVGGILVYSVCSDRQAEGEDIVAWVLSRQTVMGLQLISAVPFADDAKEYFKGRSRSPKTDSLSDAEWSKCLAFGARDSWDLYNLHTGFFIAKFRKV